MAKLFRDTAREEYFYQLGRLEAFREAGVQTLVPILETIVRNSAEQISLDDRKALYYGDPTHR